MHRDHQTVSLAEAIAPLVLTLDIGTSSVRLLCFDALVRHIDSVEARQSIDVITTATGAAEVDAHALLALCASLFDTVALQIATRADDVAAVAVATMATTMVGVDAHGEPVGPVRTYADTQSDASAHWLRTTYDEHHVHDRTGCFIRPNYWPARIHWLQQQHADEWQRARFWMTFAEFLDYQWLGIRRVTPSNAAWTGLLNRTSLQWDQVWLAELQMTDEMLSAVVDVTQAHVGVVPAITHRWPWLAQVRWYGAIGDGAAANVGSGCVNADALALTVGTTGALRVAMPGFPQPPAGLWCYRIDGATALVGGATSEGGNIYQWIRETLRFDSDDDDAIEATIACMTPDSHGLTILPLWAGERSPGWAGAAKATIHGLHLGTTAHEVLRAALESIALRFGLIAQRLPATDRVIASGGALLRSPTWLQICADVLGRPVQTSAVIETTARGVAMLALRSLGVIHALDEVPQILGQTYYPDQSAHHRYMEAQRRQVALYAQLIQGQTFEKK